MENIDVTQWKVLLVDDDLDQRIVISQVLDFYDAKVTVADSGQEALRLLETDTSFNLGLFDIRMPGMSGWQLLEEVQKHTQSTIREMPVIAVTANVMQGDRERVLSAGFKGYIPKPIEPTTLVQDIRLILEKDSNNKVAMLDLQETLDAITALVEKDKETTVKL